MEMRTVEPESAAVVAETNSPSSCGEANVDLLCGVLLGGLAVAWPMPRQQSSGDLTPAQSPFIFAQHAIASIDARVPAASAARMLMPARRAIERRTAKR